MNTIEIDDEVYLTLEKHVTGFEDTPNQVLRRVLGLSETPDAQPARTEVTENKLRTKAPKVDLETLIQIGSLTDGERLSFHDYQQNKVNGVEAIVRGKHLEFEGKRQSMSALASKVMQNQGYTCKSYRGPMFWYTSEGQSIHDLWQSYLNSNNGH